MLQLITTLVEGCENSTLHEVKKHPSIFQCSSAVTMPRPKAPERPQGYHADPKFREPFKYGYRRELVYRQPGSRIRGDVYYISPEGNYLRSANAVQLARNYAIFNNFKNTCQYW